MNRIVLRAAAIAMSVLVLSACSAKSTGGKSTAKAPAHATVTDGRMNMPAVDGNPAGLYFTVRNGTGTAINLVAVHVDGAGSTMLHEMAKVNGEPEMRQVSQIPVPAGGELKLAPGGYHVMAMKLANSLQIGGTTHATATFSDGEKISFPVRLLAPGVED